MRHTESAPWPGTIRSDKPVVSMAERWVSPDLKILLLSTLHDPREKRVRIVTQLDCGEPNPSVFAIPTGFAVRDVPAPQSQP